MGLNKLIDKVNYNARMNCCGCGACLAVCPVNSIYAVVKERGTIYYEINDNCIGCGKCKKVCPIEDDLFYPDQKRFYKAITKKKDVLQSSSSGGIAYELSANVIRKGGVVYGAGWNYDEQLVQHIRIDSVEQLSVLQGSKYVQSRISESTYKNICNDLKEKKVLVIGCPCQIAAIRKLTKDSHNLICVDIICHGVPSSKLLNEQLKSITNERVESISFRDGLNFRLAVESKNYSYRSNGLDNPYYSLYLQFVTLRESCYKCKYATRRRVGDITLGDYVESNSRFSCVVFSTQKGSELLLSIQDAIKYEESNAMELNKNHAFNKPTERNIKTDKFTKLYEIYGLQNAYYRCFSFFVFKRFLRKIMGEHLYSTLIIKIKRIDR